MKKLRRILSKIKSIVYNKLYFITDFVVKNKSVKAIKCSTNNILIVRPDNIGDYILFRNCLPYIRRSSKLKNHKITLLGNLAYRSIAETLDNDFIDIFIWINNELYYKKNISGLIFTIRTNLQLFKKNYNYIFYPVFSRTNMYDELIMKLNANEKITCSGDSVNKKNDVDKSDKIYTKIIPNTQKFGVFEFERNKEIVSGFLNEKIDINCPVIENLKEYQKHSLPDKFIAVCMEASSMNKRWPEEYFYKLISYITNTIKLPIVLLGLEQQYNSLCVYNILQSNIFDLRGKTTLPETASILSKAECFIGNDSSLIHIAAAVAVKKMIAICYGAYYGRFAPYPSIDGCDYRFIFPPEIQNNLDNPDFLKKKYADSLYEDINLITTEQVISILDEMI